MNNVEIQDGCPVVHDLPGRFAIEVAGRQTIKNLV
jgi:hypothetical protein